jgi:hypothetical protein
MLTTVLKMLEQVPESHNLKVDTETTNVIVFFGGN